MCAAPTAERRMHQRHPLSTTVQFYHGPSQRDFPGRCVDISAGGMLLYVPAATPLQVGHPIRMQLSAVNRPEFPVTSDQPIDATVVRVERQKLLTSGHIAVGVKFANA